MVSSLYFVKNIKPLFRAGVMPPYNVLYETLRRGLLDFGMGGKIEWEPVDIDQQAYQTICEELNLKNLNEHLIPKWVSNYENWDIFQYQISHGIPAEEHYELVQQERELIALKESLELDGSQDDELERCLDQLLDVSDKLSDLRMRYFNL